MNFSDILCDCEVKLKKNNQRLLDRFLFIQAFQIFNKIFVTFFMKITFFKSVWNKTGWVTMTFGKSDPEIKNLVTYHHIDKMWLHTCSASLTEYIFIFRPPLTTIFSLSSVAICNKIKQHNSIKQKALTKILKNTIAWDKKVLQKYNKCNT